ncbi:MAG: helix-turn-helix domain-containing protein [Pseudomonadales bacterium]
MSKQENAPAETEADAATVGEAEVVAQRGTLLRSQVEQVLGEYFAVLEGEHPCDLYDVVMREVEQPLLASVMRYVGFNQSQAAEVLGMSRGTLRKKLKDHGII